MAAINDLIAQVENPELRARLEQEVARLNKQKKFGLVFEAHKLSESRIDELLRDNFKRILMT